MNLASMTKQEKEAILDKFSKSEVGALIEDLRDQFRSVAEMALQTSNDVGDIKVTMAVMQNDIADIKVDLEAVKTEVRGIHKVLENHEHRITELEHA